MDKRYYVTTPIYYVNFKPHVGTSYTTILADVACRFMRMQGRQALLVTGSDEHSQNIADLAAEAGKTPREYCDEMVPKFHQLWHDISIQDYRFERTSGERHHKLVQTFWQRIFDKGDVYKGAYSGWYHTSDNRFLDEDEVPENPDSHPRLKFLTEDAYYFRLSNWQGWLEEFHTANPQFVIPDFRRNEMLKRIEGGLKDICISRTSTDWGIPLPWDDGHVFYVWIEALLTYMTGSGFDIDAFERTFDASGKSSQTRTPLWETTRMDLKSQPADNFWPCDLHTMAKDIPWFHAVIWPAMLASYGCPPPKQELIHGYWNFEGEKMSKSLGNVVDPYDAVKLVGVDGLRYFLMREVPVGLDGNFNYDALINRFNYDLANDLGNLVHRTLSMLHQNFAGRVPGVLDVTTADEEIWARLQAAQISVPAAYEQLRYSDALQEIWALIADANRYIDDKKPWELKKKPERRDELSTVFNRLVHVIRSVLILASPVIPNAAAEFWQILNLPGSLDKIGLQALSGEIAAGHQTNQSRAIFQRIDKAGLEQPAPAIPAVAAATAAPVAAAESVAENVIEFADFARVEMRTARVISAEKVENADKLLRVVVDDGERERQIVAGIAEYYQPADLPGRTVAIVANLKPRKLRGLVSEGMLLAVKHAGGLSLVTTDQPVEPGNPLS